jgi:hypothetical protein
MYIESNINKIDLNNQQRTVASQIPRSQFLRERESERERKGMHVGFWWECQKERDH